MCDNTGRQSAQFHLINIIKFRNFVYANTVDAVGLCVIATLHSSSIRWLLHCVELVLLFVCFFFGAIDTSDKREIVTANKQ